MLASIDGKHRLRDRLYLTLAVRTGYRCHELLSLTIGDVWDAAKGTVRDSITISAAAMKGHYGSRAMPLHTEAKTAIRDYLFASHRTHALYRGHALFARQGHRESITERQAYGIVIRAAEAAGVDLDRVGTHSLRKTFASKMWTHPAIDRDITKMARLLGHSNVNNTLTYVQCLDNSLELAVLTA